MALIDVLARVLTKPVTLGEIRKPAAFHDFPVTVPRGVQLRVGHFRFPGANATTWNCTIVFNKDSLVLGTLMHELVHVRQWQKYGVLGFMLRYVWQTVRHIGHVIPLEAEAYEVGDQYHVGGL